MSRIIYCADCIGPEELQHYIAWAGSVCTCGVCGKLCQGYTPKGYSRPEYKMPPEPKSDKKAWAIEPADALGEYRKIINNHNVNDFHYQQTYFGYISCFDPGIDNAENDK